MVSRYPLIFRAERSGANGATQTKRWLFLFILLLSGCNSASPSPIPATATESTLILGPASTESWTAASEFVARLRNAQYQLGATDALRVIQFTDGKFEQATPGDVDYLSVKVTDFVAAGDLNHDGVNETAALISENYGGTGVFTFLAVYADVNGTPAFITSTYVDDRPGLNVLSIDNGEIFLDALAHKSDDPLCCPTFRIVRHYRLLFNNQLDVADYTTFTPDGRWRIIAIESPVYGAETYSSVQIKGSVAIAPFENNLVYRIYDIGGVELAAGSITVNATELGGPGTFDAVIPLGTILSGALIRIEIQDISAADGSLFAMDSVELVVK